MQKSLINRVEEAAEKKERAARSLNGLFNAEGYQYLKGVAAEIQGEFKCRPTDPNWLTYSTIGYAFEQLFSRVQQIAREAQDAPTKTSILAEIQNGNRGRQPEPTGTSSDTASGNSYRTRTRAY